jgi:DNA-binding response OmpR family regulator
MDHEIVPMTKKVLIVDDEVNIVISLEFLMQQAGYTIAVARTGDEALVKLATFQPDLILLDVMLPGVNGFDICQRIRQTPAWAAMKIVMLTAKGRDVEISKGLALGANAYITKPFSTKALLAEVQQQLAPDHAPLST